MKRGLLRSAAAQQNRSLQTTAPPHRAYCSTRVRRGIYLIEKSSRRTRTKLNKLKLIGTTPPTCTFSTEACRPFLCQISSSHDLASQRKPKTTHSRLQNTQERRAPGRRSPSSCSTPGVETAPAPAKSCTHAHRRMSMLSTTHDTLATA